MTREEAIEVLNSNYPDSCFELLREAVDLSIKALKDAQPEIIRCRDCRKYRRLACPFGITVVDAPDPDGYCYKAERRTDEQDD